MKRYLIIDNPKSCEECPLELICSTEHCPLKTFPKYKSTFRPEKWWTVEDYYNHGFNDCIDEIVKGDRDES